MASPGSRSPVTTTGARLRMMMKMVLAASAVLLLTMDGNDAESTPTSTPPLEEAQLVVDEKTGSTIRTFSGRESVEFETLKRLINPDKSPGEWDKYGFAEGGKRAAEFEALRVDKVESPNGVRRLHESNVSAEEFRNTYEPLHEPLVVEGIPAAGKWQAAEWTIPLLVEKYPTMSLKMSSKTSEVVKMTMADFGRYARTQKDDTPMYVFDHTVYDDEHGKNVMSQYSVPEMFGEDLFQLVQGEPGYPSYRWFLVGPKRSGSACHNDPLGTTAWNTLISGRKLWFFAPPYLEDVVQETKDSVIAKWFLDDLPKLMEKYEDEIIMYVQHPGETMLVPAFWMHAVLNLDDTVAVTQNFVSTHTFPESWDLTKRYLRRFSDKWLQQLVIHREDLAMQALRINAAQRAQQARFKAARREGKSVDDDDDDFDP